MKRIICFALFGLVVMVFTACNGNNDKNDDLHPFFQSVAELEEIGIIMEIDSSIKHTLRLFDFSYQDGIIFEDDSYFIRFSDINGERIHIVEWEDAQTIARSIYNTCSFMYEEGFLPVISILGLSLIPAGRGDIVMVWPEELNFDFWSYAISILYEHPIWEISGRMIYERVMEIQRFIEDGNMDYLNELGLKVHLDFENIISFFNLSESTGRWGMMSLIGNEIVIIPIEDGRIVSINTQSDMEVLSLALYKLTKMNFGVMPNTRVLERDVHFTEDAGISYSALRNSLLERLALSGIVH